MVPKCEYACPIAINDMTGAMIGIQSTASTAPMSGSTPKHRPGMRKCSYDATDSPLVPQIQHQSTTHRLSARHLAIVSHAPRSRTFGAVHTSHVIAAFHSHSSIAFVSGSHLSMEWNGRSRTNIPSSLRVKVLHRGHSLTSCLRLRETFSFGSKSNSCARSRLAWSSHETERP